jgi:uncharacterized protein (DUF302 family)
MASSGLITIASKFSVGETIDRLVATIEPLELTVFARINHGRNAAEAATELRPTELLIFGNPKGGTPLMVDCQTSGIDLPVKALAWEDAQGKVWLTYNDAAWIAERHGLSAQSAHAVGAIVAGMSRVIGTAAGS